MPKDTVTKPTWTVSGFDFRTRDALIHILPTSQSRVPFDQLAPQFGQALREFQTGPLVTQYPIALAELVKAIDAEREAAGDVMGAELAVIDAAGKGLEALTAADESLDQAMARHVKAAKRVTLMREACDGLWAEIQRELKALNERLAAEAFQEATIGLAAAKLELAAAISPIMDRVARLTDLRHRGGSPAPFSMGLLKISPPPAMEPRTLPPSDLLSVGTGPGVMNRG